MERHSYSKIIEKQVEEKARQIAKEEEEKEAKKQKKITDYEKADRDR